MQNILKCSTLLLCLLFRRDLPADTVPARGPEGAPVLLHVAGARPPNPRHRARRVLRLRAQLLPQEVRAHVRVPAQGRRVHAAGQREERTKGFAMWKLYSGERKCTDDEDTPPPEILPSLVFLPNLGGNFLKHKLTCAFGWYSISCSNIK